MQAELIKKRLQRDRPMTTVTVRMPKEVVASMKKIAPVRGLSGYQTLLKLYLSEGLRRDEALLESQISTFIKALQDQGVPADAIEKASKATLKRGAGAVRA
jgi:hypothetical protein